MKVLIVFMFFLGCASTTMLRTSNKDELSYYTDRLQRLGKTIVKVDTIVQDYRHPHVINYADTSIVDTVIINYYHVKYR